MREALKCQGFIMITKLQAQAELEKCNPTSAQQDTVRTLLHSLRGIMEQLGYHPDRCLAELDDTLLIDNEVRVSEESSRAFLLELASRQVLVIE